MEKRNILVGLAMFSIACYGSSQGACDFGSGPAPFPVVVVAPSPSPSPSASPLPGVTLCALAPSVSSACAVSNPELERFVAGVQSTMTSAPSTEAAYVAALATALRAAGYCVSTGAPLSSDEIAIKTSNSFSETFDVWNQKNFPQLIYQSTCKPARF